MEIGLLFALVMGFTHAFEADHIVAVGNMVTKRNQFKLAIRDGVYWGLGHSSTILFIGLFMLVGKQQLDEKIFVYFEAAVGLMLVFLGLWRLRQLQQEGEHIHFDEGHQHKVAYGIGLVHGLAGSGVLLALVIGQLDSVASSIVYLLLFGLGSVLGMLLAAGLFSLPFSRSTLTNPKVQLGLVLLSSAVCLLLGGKLLFENLSF